jgi:hypothetical protein
MFSSKIDLMTIYIIFISILFIITFILSIFYSIKYSKYKKLVDSKDGNNKTNRDFLRKYMVSKNIFISISSVFFVGTLLLSYFKIKNKPKQKQEQVYIAKKIIDISKEKKTDENLEKADLLCDELFDKSPDKNISYQYIDMKKKRPSSEVRNLCSNYAKTINK